MRSVVTRVITLELGRSHTCPPSHPPPPSSTGTMDSADWGYVETELFVVDSQRQLRYIEWMGVEIYDFQKVTISTLFKLYNAGLGVLIPKRYHMWG